MTITFTDPGYDWTAPIWGTSVFLFVVIVGIIISVTEKHSNPRDYDGYWSTSGSFVTFLGGGILLLVAVGAAGFGTGAGVYSTRVENAKFIALADAGFDQLEWVIGDGQDNSFTANKDGAYFKGFLVQDPLAEPGTYSYRVIDTTQQKDAE